MRVLLVMYARCKCEFYEPLLILCGMGGCMGLAWDLSGTCVGFEWGLCGDCVRLEWGLSGA